MEFLKTMMESQYFTIGIFGVVAVLAIIFLILLLGGNKKEKVVDRSLINDEQTNEILENEPIVSGEENVIGMQNTEIEPVKEFTPEEFNPESNLVQSFDSTNSEQNLEPVANDNVSFETNNVIKENTYNSEFEMNNFESTEPVFGSGNNVLDASPTLDSNFEPNENLNQLNSTFEVDEVPSPIEVVEPEPTFDLPKLSDDLEEKKEIENEIPMPTAEEPRPFDIENMDL